MALPGNVGHGTVTGRFVDNAGNALEGTVTFTASPRRLLNATASPPVTILPKPVTATLNDGAFTQALIATDDEDNNPHGWTYRVDFKFTAATAESFSFELPEGSTVDLTTVSPVGSGNGTTIIRGAGVPDWDSATNSQVLTIVSGEPAWADASGGGGGGAVDSVNGQTGTVTLTASDVGAQPAGSYATAAQGAKADTAVQPGDLGTAAAADTGDFATAAQGGLADTAVQPADLSDYATNADLTSASTADRARANHTGTQAISTVTGLQSALDGKQATGDYATTTALTSGLAGKATTTTGVTIDVGTTLPAPGNPGRIFIVVPE